VEGKRMDGRGKESRGGKGRNNLPYDLGNLAMTWLP